MKTIKNSITIDKFGYKIGKKIGKGSYSTVKVINIFLSFFKKKIKVSRSYNFQLAYSLHHEMLVALKIIRKNRASMVFNKHFLPREIEVVKGLNHPNIIRYIQCIETDQRYT